MGDFGCGGGGWTLALKTDGAKVLESLVFAAVLIDVVTSSWFCEMDRENMQLELCCDFTFRTGKTSKVKAQFLHICSHCKPTSLFNLRFRSVLIDRLIKLANIRLATVVQPVYLKSLEVVCDALTIKLRHRRLCAFYLEKIYLKTRSTNTVNVPCKFIN